MKQVNLPEVRLSRDLCYTLAVLDCDSVVGVSDDTVSLDELDG